MVNSPSTAILPLDTQHRADPQRFSATYKALMPLSSLEDTKPGLPSLPTPLFSSFRPHVRCHLHQEASPECQEGGTISFILQTRKLKLSDLPQIMWLESGGIGCEANVGGIQLAVTC